MKKAPWLVSGFLASLLFLGVSISHSSGEGSWGKLVYDTEVSPQTKDNFKKAFDFVQ